MPKKIKKLLEFIPLVILTIFAAYLVWIRLSEGILFTWRHWFVLLLLPLNFYLFRRNHQLGVLALGFILIMGLLGLAQYSPGVSISYAYWTPFDAKIPVFYGQPIFLLWLIVHFVFSGRYYFGIAKRKYWVDLSSTLKSANTKPELPVTDETID